MLFSNHLTDKLLKESYILIILDFILFRSKKKTRSYKYIIGNLLIKSFLTTNEY